MRHFSNFWANRNVALYVLSLYVTFSIIRKNYSDHRIVSVKPKMLKNWRGIIPLLEHGFEFNSSLSAKNGWYNPSLLNSHLVFPSFPLVSIKNVKHNNLVVFISYFFKRCNWKLCWYECNNAGELISPTHSTEPPHSPPKSKNNTNIL